MKAFEENLIGSYVEGKMVLEGKTEPFVSLPLQKQTKTLHLADEKLLKKTLDIARKGQKEISQKTAYFRSEALKKTASLLRKKQDQLAEIMSHEMGKNLVEAKAEVEYSAAYFDWFAGEAVRIYGTEIPGKVPGKTLRVLKEPVGIVAMITPWNFPLAMGARKIAPALAAGCAVIAKPSIDTCLSMLALAELAIEAGIPPSAVSIIVGDGPLFAETILPSPDVRKFTFTGSTETGELLYRQCVPTFKKVTLELGGHAPLIVFDDADLDVAVRETVKAKLRNSGQSCICPNRMYVHESLFDAFTEKLVQEVKKLKIGPPLDQTTQVSDTIHPTSVQKVPSHVQDALKKGAKCLLGGEQPHEPTILTGVTEEMLLYREETFGPVFPLISFSTEQEVLEKASDTIYGLAGYFFTQNLDRAWRVAKALQFGIIGLNDGVPSAAEVPFGGIKFSGLGREGGPTGINEFLSEKTVSIARQT